MLEKLVVIPKLASLLFLGQLDYELVNPYITQNQNSPVLYTEPSRKPSISTLKGVYCGTLQEVFDNSPKPHHSDTIITIEYISKFNDEQKFLIDFYHRGKITHVDRSIEPEKWIDKKDFYAFTINELDKNGKRMPKITASGYFKGAFMLVLYDFFTREGDKLSIPEPDGFIEGVSCSIIEGKKIYSLINDIADLIAERRTIQSKKNKQNF